MAKQTKQRKTKKEVNTADVVLYFIEQKILEITAAVLSVWMIYLLGYWNPFGATIFSKDFWGTLTNGLVTICLCFMVALLLFIIGMSIFQFIRANWEWAKKRASK